MEPQSQLDGLVARKRQLEAKIASENERPIPDSLRIAELKKEKLRLKEEIVRLDHH